jgi:hypothetical protein
MDFAPLLYVVRASEGPLIFVIPAISVVPLIDHIDLPIVLLLL